MWGVGGGEVGGVYSVYSACEGTLTATATLGLPPRHPKGVFSPDRSPQLVFCDAAACDSKDFAANDPGSWKHEVYSRMIQNLFDECRFFPKYPPQVEKVQGG